MILINSLILIAALSCCILCANQPTTKFSVSQEELLDARLRILPLLRADARKFGADYLTDHLDEFQQLCKFIIDDVNNYDETKFINMLTESTCLSCVAYRRMFLALGVEHPFMSTLGHMCDRKLIQSAPSDRGHVMDTLSSTQGFILRVSDAHFSVAGKCTAPQETVSLANQIEIGGCSTTLKWIEFIRVTFKESAIDTLNRVLKRNPQITRLHIKKTEISSHFCYLDMSPLENLSVLEISNQPISNTALRLMLIKVPDDLKLKDLYLQHCSLVGALAVSRDLLLRMKNLRTLDYIGNNLDQHDLLTLCELLHANQNLLFLGLQIPTTVCPVKCPAKFIDALMHAPQLKMLTLINISYNECDIKRLAGALSKMHQMERIVITIHEERTKYISKFGSVVKALGHVPRIGFQGGYIDKTIIEHLCSNANLREIQFRSVDFATEDVPISRLFRDARLSYLEISHCSELRSTTAITDVISSVKYATMLNSLHITTFIPEDMCYLNQLFFRELSLLPALKTLIIEYPVGYGHFDPLCSNPYYAEGNCFEHLETLKYDSWDLTMDKLKEIAAFVCKLSKLTLLVIYSDVATPAHVEFMDRCPFKSSNATVFFMKKRIIQ